MPPKPLKVGVREQDTRRYCRHGHLECRRQAVFELRFMGRKAGTFRTRYAMTQERRILACRVRQLYAAKLQAVHRAQTPTVSMLDRYYRGTSTDRERVSLIQAGRTLVEH